MENENVDNKERVSRSVSSEMLDRRALQRREAENGLQAHVSRCRQCSNEYKPYCHEAQFWIYKIMQNFPKAV
jgi:hypothetical protein